MIYLFRDSAIMDEVLGVESQDEFAERVRDSVDMVDIEDPFENFE